MIIGHWGEFIPFLERMDEALFAEHLNHPVAITLKIILYHTEWHVNEATV